jgi:capsular exopolysaccharide synthesis family protein
MSIEQRIILIQEPNSLTAESYRSLRAALSRSLAKGKRRFTIVSAWGGEGKSMVSANLAVAFSQLLMDVVLVDGDLRRPTLSRVFEQDTKPGLMELLETGGDTLERVYPTPIERLSILPAGQSRSNPGDLLGKGTFEEVMRHLAATDKCVVIDTSPMSACSDALLMGIHSDGAVMVVSPDKWQGEAEAHFVQDLEDHGIEVFGAVLNNADPSEKVPGSSSSSYGYGYGYGYGQGYGREHAAPAKEKSRLATLLSRKKPSKGKE